jgi:dTDP-4-amino-4,6-dideoxygalactose transaminase
MALRTVPTLHGGKYLVLAKPESLVRLNDFAALWQEIGGEVLDAVRRVGESGWYVLGREVREFEAELAHRFGAKASIGCGSGLDALEIALRAVGVGAGDLVLTTPLTAFATTLAIVRMGAVPAFVDVDASGLLDLHAAAAFLKEYPKTRAMIPVHLYGVPMDLDRLLTLREEFGVEIIEDCAQSIDSAWKGRPTGTASRAAATSFYPTKNLGAFGDAGAVLANDDEVETACRSLRDYGQTAKYTHSVLGLNSRLDEVHAAILRDAVLPRLGAHTARRRAIAARYRERIEHRAIGLLETADGASSNFHLFPVRVTAGDRADFMRHLESAGVQSAIHYPKLANEQPALAETRIVTCGSLPNAHRLAATEVSLPIHPALEDAEVDRVIAAVNAW